MTDQETGETLYELEKMYDYNHASFIQEYVGENKDTMWVWRNEPWYLYKLKDQFEQF